MSELRQDLDKFHLRLKRHVYLNRDPVVTDVGTKVGRSQSFCNVSQSQGSTLGPRTSESLTQVSDLHNIDADMFKNLGPFEHREFTKPSDFEPKQNPQSLETFIDMNEIQLSKVISRKNKPQNIMKEERQGLRELAMRDDIVVKKADKGSNIVIMRRDDYVAKGLKQLSDTKYYLPQSENLTQKHNKEIGNFLRLMRRCGEISEKTFQYLWREDPRTLEFYLLPKIHKNVTPPPGRPIISANDCPTETISKLVDFFVKVFLTDIKLYLKDTTAFINRLKNIGRLPAHAILFSFDVVSLYTYISY